MPDSSTPVAGALLWIRPNIPHFRNFHAFLRNQVGEYHWLYSFCNDWHLTDMDWRETDIGPLAESFRINHSPKCSKCIKAIKKRTDG